MTGGPRPCYPLPWAAASLGKALDFPTTPGQPNWGCLLHSWSPMTPDPHKLLSPGYLGCIKALHTSFGREVLLGVSFPPCTPSPLPSPLLFLFTSSQGTRSLQTLIFPVSQYLLNWPLLFSRAFPSLAAQSQSPQGFLWPPARAGNGSWLPAIVLGCASGSAGPANRNWLSRIPRPLGLGSPCPARASWLGNGGV